MPQTTTPSSSSTSKDDPKPKTSLPAQLSNLQKDTKYVSPYAPVANSQPTSPTSNTRKPESKMSGKAISTADKARMMKSLKSQSVNQLIELRRLEKALANTGGPRPNEVTDALQTAWAHYVNSNNLLSELRGMTKSYPFSSECLDEAKWMVISDAASKRSWNYCWLVLQKVKNQYVLALLPCRNLIAKHARTQAAKPVMWGGRKATQAQLDQLAANCTAEWTRALSQILRHWEAPPLM